MTFRGCVAPALPWVQCEPSAFLRFVLSWGLFLSPLLLSPGCWRDWVLPSVGTLGAPVLFCAVG